VHDPFAMALLFDKNLNGYLSKTKNEAVPRLIDEGKESYAYL
jgi:hypothetical protein